MGDRGAIVIGGGVNGMIAATTLARGGRDVCLLERRDSLGGLSAEEEFHSGYKANGLLTDTTGFRRGVADPNRARHDECVRRLSQTRFRYRRAYMSY